MKRAVGNIKQKKQEELFREDMDKVVGRLLAWCKKELYEWAAKPPRVRGSGKKKRK